MSEATPRRASERAQTALREQILSGDLPGGTRLGEVELAERLGLSRTPVREALSRLAAEGLVELHAHRGARVTEFTETDLEDIFDVRRALEPRATERAAGRASTADLDELDALAQEMLAIGSPGPGQDLDRLVELNQRFHARLLEIAAAPTLTAALAGVVHAPVVLRTFHSYDAASLARSLAHHVEIVAALRAGDGGWAAAVMVSHLANARAVMTAARGVLPTAPSGVNRNDGCS
ncbi:MULTISPECIES: GntR family transcriptional regulator [Pseudonocardia]|uniref:GntR family transcriptional regulator n=2 Tax=Pseudonocardia TaxID=1847 RepID=A0ABQ0RRE2_9PSEU|nr:MULTISPECIES: GntR family transcriptional regulator [Pseudonocardia]OSY43276.1 putative HTH-type transcriptional regulator YdfH [Pseudonocardia autotrophica]TDN71764.1 DNA-binding GntR family transcriptional regulator [Pseudonocardia autotrophica]BBG02451.1 GntR family transcriptional regulator [Pseudonocardia autotrophica]GEC23213.1 GntR family transcriptional regulator [Pseudonocardia saturnea]